MGTMEAFSSLEGQGGVRFYKYIHKMERVERKKGPQGPGSQREKARTSSRDWWLESIEASLELGFFFILSKKLLLLELLALPLLEGLELGQGDPVEVDVLHGAPEEADRTSGPERHLYEI